jgi:hypothetical protein
MGLSNEKFSSALCSIAWDQTLQANISAKSKQNSKIFEGVTLWPRGNRLTKKLRVENLVTLFFSFSL